MRQVFRELLRDADMPGWRVWLAVLADVPGSLLPEHLARRTGRDLAVGAAFGPQPLCFHLPQGADPATRLWSPDLELLLWVSEPIPLPPASQDVRGR